MKKNMKKQILSEEFRRMQKLAGIINENEEFENNFPSLDYNTVIKFIEDQGYQVTSDYYDGGFDANQGKYFVGVFEDHITVTDSKGKTKVINFFKNENEGKKVPLDSPMLEEKENNHYIIKFGFNDDDGEYKVVNSKPIYAQNEEEAANKLRDQFESYEGIPIEIISIERSGLNEDENITSSLTNEEKLYLENKIEEFLNNALFNSDILVNDSGESSPTKEELAIQFIIDSLKERISYYN